MLTKEEQEIEKMLNKISQGQWKASHFVGINKSYVDAERTVCVSETSNRVNDTEFIAKSPDFIRYCLNTIKMLRNEIANQKG